ncbi:tRNAHis guanylyltransferase-domain-containing protein, partial [Chytriomyces sp. MP71]
FVVRVDGVSFATFTGGLVKPFDRRLKHAMVAATIDLATKFQPVLAYHHSDEISLVFLAAQPPPTDTYGNDAVPSAVAPQEHSASAVTKAPKRIKPDADMKTHTYAGRVQKLASVVAAYASVRFNYHLSRHDWSDRDEKVRARMTGHEAYFDGRVVPVPDVTTAMDCIFWRSNFDGFRNSVSGIAQHHFKHTQLQNKNLPQLLDMLAGLNINVMDTYGPKYLFGTWVKKESYFVKAKDLDLPPEALKRLAPDSLVSRRRVRTGSFNWADYSAEERTKFLAAKFWPDDERAPPKDDLPEAEK